jgi:hypothetical protein
MSEQRSSPQSASRTRAKKNVGPNKKSSSSGDRHLQTQDFIAMAVTEPPSKNIHSIKRISGGFG